MLPNGRPRPRDHRCRANMAHVKQPRPDSSIGFQAKVLKPFKLFPRRAVQLTSTQEVSQCCRIGGRAPAITYAGPRPGVSKYEWNLKYERNGSVGGAIGTKV